MLREGLATAQDLRTTPRRDYPRLIVAGWQRWKRRRRPVAYTIGDHGQGPLYNRLSATPRYEWLRGRFFVNFMPMNQHLRAIRTMLTAQLEDGLTPDETEQRIGDCLRMAADQFPEIGKDYLAVLLPPPGERRIQSRYAALDAPTQQGRSLDEQTPPYTGPVGFTPWVVAPQYQGGPQVLVNSQTWVTSGPVGDLALELYGPPVPLEDETRWEMASQHRRPWPP